MNTIKTNRLTLVTGLTLALLVGLGATVAPKDRDNPNRDPARKAVTGGFDWSIVPPNLPAYIIPGTDGDLYLRNAPLVGTFALTGRGITLDPTSTKISVQLSGELDPNTFNGVLWTPAVLTATIDGVKTIIFEGAATADTVGLVSTGKATLTGRGPFEGTKLEFTFEEIGPGNSDTYTLTGYLSPAPRR
jgi:hypothetical protein